MNRCPKTRFTANYRQAGLLFSDCFSAVGPFKIVPSNLFSWLRRHSQSRNLNCCLSFRTLATDPATWKRRLRGHLADRALLNWGGVAAGVFTTKVVVTATTTDTSPACVFANYQGEGGRDHSLSPTSVLCQKSIVATPLVKEVPRYRRYAIFTYETTDGTDRRQTAQTTARIERRRG